MYRKNAWKNYDEAELKKVMSFAKEYENFLSDAKTEREANDYAIAEIEKAGYQNLDELIASGKAPKAGDKLYRSNMGKGIVMFQLGTDPLEKGMNILGAHIDSPRLDLKQNPLYEDTDMALLETHYYGGIKKYQWTARPLALHGVICRKDGTKVTVRLGENEDDPVFGVSDLLIHLAADQLKKDGAHVVEGEDLNVLIGSMPLKDTEKDAVKANILRILKEQYNIEEEDFLSAEIEVVPAGKARDLGFDRSLIMAYGHDDRVCAFPSYKAMLELPAEIKRTACCLLVDKEEIGSVGATGMESRFFENTMAELLHLMGSDSDLAVRRAIAASTMLSSDVSAGFDPNYPSVMEKNNCCYLGQGLVINKYTGRAGKAGSNDANAEYMAKIRRVFDEQKVCFQTAELGKVDQGGGGTIAFIMGNYNMNVIDAGIAVQNMHAPYEVISKADLYEALKGYVAFLEHMN